MTSSLAGVEQALRMTRSWAQDGRCTPSRSAHDGTNTGHLVYRARCHAVAKYYLMRLPSENDMVLARPRAQRLRHQVQGGVGQPLRRPQLKQEASGRSWGRETCGLRSLQSGCTLSLLKVLPHLLKTGSTPNFTTSPRILLVWWPGHRGKLSA
jgi:hypothetical protein